MIGCVGRYTTTAIWSLMTATKNPTLITRIHAAAGLTPTHCHPDTDSQWDDDAIWPQGM
jgi:hypothetical protein